MKIYVAFANDVAKRDYAGLDKVFCELAVNDRWQKHSVALTPESADCILFIDAQISLSVDYYRLVDDHPLTRKHPEKIMVYDEYDRPPCYGRGIYVSIPKPLFDSARHSVVCYWLNGFDSLPPKHVSCDRPNFCFFSGAVTYNPTRSRIVRQLTNSVVTVKDTSAVSPWKSGRDAPSNDALLKSRDEYSRMMLSHQYCLAPQGKGTSSLRLFECLSHRTVPIILSDQYVHPRVRDWNRAVVSLPQRKPREVLRLQSELQSQFSERQSILDSLVSNYFGPDSRWNFYGDQLEYLLNKGGRWSSRSSSDELRTRLYWIWHRLSKKLEGIVV